MSNDVRDAGNTPTKPGASSDERDQPRERHIYVTLGDLSPELLDPTANPAFVVAGQGESLFVGLWDAMTPTALERMVRSHIRYLPSGAFQQMQISGTMLAELVSTVANLPRDELLEVSRSPRGFTETVLPGIGTGVAGGGGGLLGIAPARGPADDDARFSAGWDDPDDIDVFVIEDSGQEISQEPRPDDDTKDVEAPSEPDEPSLGEKILHALKHSPTDFRTVKSLAKELGVGKRTIEDELEKLGDQVRRPLGQEARYPDWYRLTEKGPTRQEKRARLKAIVTFSSMDDDF